MNSKITFTTVFLLLINSISLIFTQKNVTKANDSNTPLNLITPDYPVPYGIVKTEKITAILNRIYGYLNEVTPMNFVNSKTSETLTDLSEIDENSEMIKLLKTNQFEINYSSLQLLLKK